MQPAYAASRSRGTGLNKLPIVPVVGVWAGREARSLVPGIARGVSAACPHCWRNFPALPEHAALPRHLDDLGLRCDGSGHSPDVRLDEKPDPRSTVFGAWVHLNDEGLP